MKGHPDDDRTQSCVKAGARVHDITHRTGTAAIRIHIFNSTFWTKLDRLEPIGRRSRAVDIPSACPQDSEDAGRPN